MASLGKTRKRKEEAPAFAVVRRPASSEESVLRHAREVFGDAHKASHWLATPLSLLDDRSPSQVLTTPRGVERIEKILTRIEHNIPS